MKGIESAFIGVLSKDPESKTGRSGKPYANFSCNVASEAGNPGRINVICFGSIAEELVKVAHRGDKVYVEGHLSLAKWENAEGEARSGLAVSAWRVDLIGAANLGRNRVENPRGSPEPPQASFPIVLPAVKKRPFGRLFRKLTQPPGARAKPKKEAAHDANATESVADATPPFNDPLPF